MRVACCRCLLAEVGIDTSIHLEGVAHMGFTLGSPILATRSPAHPLAPAPSQDCTQLKEALQAAGVECGETSLVYHPSSTVECSEEVCGTPSTRTTPKHPQYHCAPVCFSGPMSCERSLPAPGNSVSVRPRVGPVPAAPLVPPVPSTTASLGVGGSQYPQDP